MPDIFDQVASGDIFDQIAPAPQPTPAPGPKPVLARPGYPKPPAPPLPEELAPEYDPTFKQDYGIMAGPISGLYGLYRGVERMAEPGAREKAGAAHEILGGAFQAATPFVAATGVGAPVRTAVTLGAGIAAQKGVTAGLDALGLPHEYGEVAGDLAGIVAGAAAMPIAERMVLRARIQRVLQDRLNAEYAARRNAESVARQPKQLEPPPDIFDEVAPDIPYADAVTERLTGRPTPGLEDRKLLGGARPGTPARPIPLPGRTAPGQPGEVIPQPPAYGAQRQLPPGPEPTALDLVDAGVTRIEDLPPGKLTELLNQISDRIKAQTPMLAPPAQPGAQPKEPEPPQTGAPEAKPEVTLSPAAQASIAASRENIAERHRRQEAEEAAAETPTEPAPAPTAPPAAPAAETPPQPEPAPLAPAALPATMPGARAVAQRIVNAENNFIEMIMDRGFTREEAVNAMAAMRKLKMAKLDAVGGRISVTHGKYLDPDVIRNVIGKSAPQPAAPTPGTDVVPATGLLEMPVSQIHADPVRFQFKRDVGQGGAGEELKTVQKFDPELSGVISVWRDPADGKTYVVNGHHRLDLAKRLGYPALVVRYIGAKDAQAARAKGALINIAEGRGTAIDAAKFFRDTNTTPAELEAQGISLKGPVAREGVALSRLAPSIFDAVLSGDMPVKRAAIIGESLERPEDQIALVELATRAEKGGKRLRDDDLAELIRRTAGAEKRTTTTQSLFGENEETQNLALEETRVSRYVRDRLGSEKKLFSTVSKGGASEQLASAGNVMRTEANVQLAEQASQAQAIYDKLSLRAGPVDDAIRSAAQSIAKGAPEREVREHAYARIRAALSETLTGRQGPIPGGLQAGGTGGSGATVRPSGNLGPSEPSEKAPLTPEEFARETRAAVERAPVPGQKEALEKQIKYGKTVSEADLEDSPLFGRRQGGLFGGETGSISADLLTLGLASFIRNDVAPNLRAAVMVLKRAGDDIQKLLAPASRGYAAELTAQSVRAHAADLARSTDRAEAALRIAARYFDTRTPEENYAFMDAIERGEKQEDPQLQTFADTMREMLDTRREAIRALGTGKLQKFIENYFPHLWKDKKAAEEFYQNFGKRPLEGSKAFLKKRSIETIAEGLAAGLEPVSNNPVDLVLLKAREMDKYLMAHRVLNELKAQGIARYKDVFDPMPYGYAQIDDRIATVFGNPNVPISEAFDKNVTERLEKLAAGLGIEHTREPDIGRGSALGYAVPGGGIKTKFATPESVLAHEIGHQLEWKFGISALLRGKPGVAAELRKLADLRFEGQEATESYKRYVRGKDEKIANAIAALLYAPAKFKATAPETWDYLRDELWHIPALKPLFDIEPSMVLGTRQAEVPAGGLVIKGNFIAPEPATRVLNHYLSPGLRENSGLFRAYLGAANLLNQAQLGWSAFHLAFTTMDAAMSKLALGIYQTAKGHPGQGLFTALKTPIAPFTGIVTGHQMMKEWYAPGTQGERIGALVNAVVSGGGRARMDAFYRSHVTKKMMEAFGQGNLLGGLLRAPFALTEQAARPLMEYIVPRQKLGVFADLAAFELERLGPEPEEEDLRAALGRAWDSVDNRMGQLVYDNLFWHKVAKDLAMASVRSVGWNVGTLREIGGGGIDALKFAAGKGDFTTRMSYIVALPILAGLIGATLYYLWHGHGPKDLKDYYFPRDPRGQRWSLPSYVKDAYHWGTEPVRTARGKIHPLATLIWEMLSNEDYQQREIRNPNHPLVRQMMELAKHVGQAALPLSLKNVQQNKKKGTEETVLPFFGITPAPKSLDHAPLHRRQLNP